MRQTQTAGEVIAGGTTNLHAISPSGSAVPTLSRTSQALIERYPGGAAEVLAVFNPSMQIQFCRDEERARFGAAPTVGLLRRTFGRNTAESWLEIQLEDLSEFAGVHNKLSAKQRTELAAIMADDYGHYRLTEFMLFFQQIKRGTFGKFYGAVDPIVILEALAAFDVQRSGAWQAFRDAERRRATAAAIDEAEALRARYMLRVAEADRCHLSLLQYRMLGFDTLPNDALRRELAALRRGEKTLPADIVGLLNVINQNND